MYGGYPPYTITNIGDPLPAGLSYDLEQRAWGALPFLVGTTSQQGRFDLAFRITDSASTLGAFTDNSVDYVGTVEIYKTLMIAHTVLNVGTIEIPYKYKITDNYAPGDVDYPTAYGIESGGQGFLPTGYVCYHDPDTHENFIQGTTTFSNAFPITLGGYTARYSGGVPRATWNTVLLVGGVVVLTHEVL